MSLEDEIRSFFDQLDVMSPHMREAAVRRALVEKEAVQAIRALAAQMVLWAEIIWMQGDGNGAGVKGLIWEVFTEAGLVQPEAASINSKQPIPDRLRRQILKRDDYLCRYCGSHREITVDHIVPASKGGPTTEENLVACCRSCNSKKGTKTWAVPGNAQRGNSEQTHAASVVQLAQGHLRIEPACHRPPQPDHPESLGERDGRLLLPDPEDDR